MSSPRSLRSDFQVPTSEVISRLPPDAADPGTWWAAYSGSLERGSLSGTARSVIQIDSQYILDRGILGVGPAGSPGWPEGRVRRGLVAGSVQSGKTASVLGVTALALDHGIDAIIVLAGTRIGLWHQTYDRLVDQLHLKEGGLMRGESVVMPDPELVGTGARSSPRETYVLNGARARRALERGSPIIIVAMKNVDHLRVIKRAIHEQLVPAVERLGRAVHLLVLDDEADDASILDARVEQGLDPMRDDLKQVPRGIVDLWARRPHDGSTASPLLYATYVGYTATPQANLLQADHNPLAPRDFIVSLRVPFDAGGIEPRTTTYREPDGLSSYYIGGAAFYERHGGKSLCCATTGDPEADLAAAMKAFLMASAIRLWRERRQLGPSMAMRTRFPDKEHAAQRSPRPTSMLLHPSSAMDDHFDAAARILAWAAGSDLAEGSRLVREGSRALPSERLRDEVDGDPRSWMGWLDDYRTSAKGIATSFGLPKAPRVPGVGDWDEVAHLLRDEVIPGTKVAVINSDPSADDRPRFEPIEQEDGTWACAPDLSTIFVSGNVMSRGLTLEGLVTTLFLRQAHDAYADTQMQMQRWFGYRGSYLDLCRVFSPEPQIKLFRDYHEADEAMRREIVSAMASAPLSAPSPTVIGGKAFHATGKLVNVNNVPLCPGSAPFVRLVNAGDGPDPNADLLAEALGRGSHEVVVNDRVRGRILDTTLDLLETADLLDRLRFDSYRPGPDSWEARRWRALEAHISLTSDSKAEGDWPLYRPGWPVGHHLGPSESRGDCPYAFAAYLRLWNACLNRGGRALYPTDDGSLPWRMLDLAVKQREAPSFHIGVRFGSAEPITTGPLAALDYRVRPMRRAVSDGELVGIWGTRNPSEADGAYLGDALFDYHVHDHEPPRRNGEAMPWRPPGAPGLVLFHVIERPGRPHPVVTVGLGIPLGGPDQFAAQTPR